MSTSPGVITRAATAATTTGRSRQILRQRYYNNNNNYNDDYYYYNYGNNNYNNKYWKYDSYRKNHQFLSLFNVSSSSKSSSSSFSSSSSSDNNTATAATANNDTSNNNNDNDNNNDGEEQFIDDKDIIDDEEMEYANEDTASFIRRVHEKYEKENATLTNNNLHNNHHPNTISGKYSIYDQSISARMYRYEQRTFAQLHQRIITEQQQQSKQSNTTSNTNNNNKMTTAVTRNRGQQQQSSSSSSISQSSVSEEKTSPLPWELSDEYDQHYDPLDDYYKTDVSLRIPKQYTIAHYEKAKNTLQQFITLHHLQVLMNMNTNSTMNGSSDNNDGSTSAQQQQPNYYFLPIVPDDDRYNPPTTTAANDASSSDSKADPKPPIAAASTVNACINLLEAVYYELGECNTLPRDTIRELSEYFTSPNIVNPIINTWKFISLQYVTAMKQKYGNNYWKQNEPRYQHYGYNEITNEYIEPITLDQYDCIQNTDYNIPIPGRIMIQKIIRLSHYLPMYEYDISVINMILQVIIIQSPTKQKAPYIAENIMDYILRHKKSTRRTHSGKLYLDVYTYSLLLSAWCESSSAAGTTTNNRNNRFPNRKSGTTKQQQQQQQNEEEENESNSTINYKNHVHQKIEQLLDQMKVRNILPNMVIYNTLIRFWGKHGSIQQLKKLQEEMEQIHNIIPDIQCRSLLIYGYVQVWDSISIGEEQFQMILLSQFPNHNDEQSTATNKYKRKNRPLDRRTIDIIQKSAHYILDAYRKRLNYTKSIYEKGRIVKKAEFIMSQLQHYHLLKDSYGNNGGGQIYGTMMDIYSRVNNVERAYMAFQHIQQPNIVQYNILINAYGKGNRPDKAQETVNYMLENNIIPDIGIFNTLINAWAESSNYSKTTHFEHDDNIMDGGKTAMSLIQEVDVTEGAFDVLRMLREHPICIKYNIVPNDITYNTLLKCLSSRQVRRVETLTYNRLDIFNNQSSPVRQAEMILNEMEGSEECKPDAISYTLAIRTCLQNHDTNRAEQLLRKMEVSSSDIQQPNTITYNIILNYYSKLHTIKAAERASQLLDYMISMSYKPSSTSSRSSSVSSSSKSSVYEPESATLRKIAPDLYSYSRVLAAWAGCCNNDGEHQNYITASNRIWEIYESMINNKPKMIELNMVCYTIIVNFLSKTNDPTDLQRALQVLHAMVDQSKLKRDANSANSVQPDYWHYKIVLNRAIEIKDVAIAEQVLRLMVDAYVQSANIKKPKSEMYEMVVKEYIRNDNLQSASNLLLDMKKVIEKYRKPIGLDVSTLKCIMDAWNESNHTEKDVYLQRLTDAFFEKELEQQWRGFR